MNFKTGLYHLNKNENYNFQLNRLINWDGGDLAEIQKISHTITTNLEWKIALIQLGDRAMKENRIENAIAYYRMSEFFMADTDADKLTYYKKAKALFYDFYQGYFEDKRVEKVEVPFRNMKLPVLHTKAVGQRQGCILMHGGNDSYLEELFFPMLYLSAHGYEVYLFEGPGQGGVLREQGMTFIYQWEKPVQTILDYFNLENVVIIGISLGGMLAPRAAAFEKRIQRVVAWSIFPHFLEVALYDLPMPVRTLFKILLNLRCKALINGIMYREMEQDVFMQWVLEHGMHAYGAASPYDYLKNLNDFQIINIADKITQDVLILHGKNDHFIDWRMYKDEIACLTQAKSITLRLFTKEEQASDHCQCGNTKLALDTILKWLETFQNDDKKVLN